MKNNNLIIYYKDKSKDVFSFSLETSEEAALAKFEEIRPEVDRGQIQKYFYTKEDELPLDMYGRFTEVNEEGKIKIDARSVIISERLEEIRKKRDMFISKLDIPFMRALEDENELVKNHIKQMKNFLRDLPNKLRFHELKDTELINYNPFGNIFEIVLINNGEGYQKPPKVIIDEPKKPMIGFASKATALIKDGSVVKLVITDHGCGYNYMPKVTIEAPEQGQAAIAICLPPQNAMVTEEDIVENTRKNYQ